jgi:hypothetical protein
VLNLHRAARPNASSIHISGARNCLRDHIIGGIATSIEVHNQLLFERKSEGLEVECHRRKTRASIPLYAIRRPHDTPIWKLEAALKCRSCRKGDMRGSCT